MRMTLMKRYGFLWVTGTLFLFSLVGHWIFGWFEYVNEQAAHGQPIETAQFVVQLARGTLENWQSEFLQLMWQVAGLTYLLYVGSPQSKEGNDRLEDKIDAILRKVDPAGAERLLNDLEARYPGRGAGNTFVNPSREARADVR
jgi:hypothetical protein